MYKIFIVEDDETIAGIVAAELEGWGFAASRAVNFYGVLEEFKTAEPQLVLLDLSLPYRSGFFWCAEIRKQSKVPIIFISSAADNMNLVQALHQGADDFIAKPFEMPVTSTFSPWAKTSAFITWPTSIWSASSTRSSLR